LNIGLETKAFELRQIAKTDTELVKVLMRKCFRLIDVKGKFDKSC